MFRPRCPAAYVVLLCLFYNSSFAQVDSTRGGPVTPERLLERYQLNSATPANLEFAPDPAGSGRIVLLARVRDTDEKVAGGARTEISPQKEYVRHGVRWYAMSMYLPTDWQFSPEHTIIGQIHTSQKKSTVVAPPVHFSVRGRNLELKLQYNHRSTEGPDPVTRENSTSQTIRLESVRTGQWYCFVVRADWSSTPGQGSMRIWMNGDMVYEAVNSHNSYETWLGNYPKSGLYVPGKMSVRERRIYVDFIHVGGVNSKLEEMAALTPCGAPASGSRGK